MELRSRGRRTPPHLINVQVGTPQCPVPDDEVVLAEAKTMYTRLRGGDWLLYYTKERWIGNSNAHMMYFSNWDTALCEAIWLAYMEWQAEEERRTQPPSFVSEAEMTTALISMLHAEGWTCRMEYLTPYGRVDVLASAENRQAMIEVKLATDGNTLKAALGQLLAYGLAMPEAELWIASALKAVPPRFLPLFHHYHITIREVPCLKTTME